MGKTPKSIKTEMVEFLGYELRFHVLDNGKKVIEADDVEGFLKYLEKENPPMTSEDVTTLNQYIGEL